MVGYLNGAKGFIFNLLFAKQGFMIKNSISIYEREIKFKPFMAE